MKKLCYFVVVGLLLSVQAISQNRYQPKYASTKGSKILQDADTLISKSWLTFKADVDTSSFFTRYAEDLGLKQNPNLKFIKVKEEKDPTGMTHARYQLFYKKLKMEGLEYLVHSKEGKVKAANGKIITDVNLDVAKAKSPKEILSTFLSRSEKGKITVQDSLAPELIITRSNIEDFTGESLRLAYKVNVVDSQPFDAYIAYLDADTGELIKKTPSIYRCFASNHSHRDQIGSSQINPLISKGFNFNKSQSFLPPSSATFTPTRARYGTNVSLETWINTAPTQSLEWRFLETSNGSSWWIQHNVVKNYSTSNVFSPDQNTRWSTFWGSSMPYITNPNSSWGTNQQVATTAHWAFQQSYKYFRDVHGRQGPGNIGRSGVVIPNIPQNEPNLGFLGPFYWKTFTTGVGGELIGIQSWTGTDCATLDIIAHELTHGITSYTSGLVYEREPGALNESISDIFAYCVERRTLPTSWNWLMGEDVGTNRHFRDMQNPGSIPFEPALGRVPQPNTYLGPFWHDTVNDPGDSYGVHTNSGVMNNMFYLLVAGGSRNGFTINAIPFDRAERIFYLAFGSYMLSNDDYADARAATLLAAQNLYGNCSTEFRMVGRAWGAVGVGTGSGCPGGGRMSAEEISQNEESDDFQLTSTPNNGKFEVLLTLKDKSPVNLSVLDMQGKQFFNKDLNGAGKHIEQIELKSATSGNYLVVVKRQNGIEVKKTLVVK
ncbi:Por secretion system C-terminal sorting domain-containing protein [Dyadobacter sp. SG02]|uniref:M4 family metallopeptidase n=1 Tax=Dyadobacter sp. SG02 TaxID=1855291 RepID=UPI0008B9C44F|nr:M4 family metallopeptidase [Dyadobacter sp. SG02]SEJ15646.1 Por secretion system C-terminal sorting domain-containing protein [Dyadobacter sp. SG02]